MSVTPRVLLSIDYEPWFAPFRRFDNLTDSFHRRNLDDGFTLRMLDPILNMLGDAKASFYLIGEVAEWYPEIPQRTLLRHFPVSSFGVYLDEILKSKAA